MKSYINQSLLKFRSNGRFDAFFTSQDFGKDKEKTDQVTLNTRWSYNYVVFYSTRIFSF